MSQQFSLSLPLSGDAGYAAMLAASTVSPVLLCPMLWLYSIFN